jgi:hypothetical protein
MDSVGNEQGGVNVDRRPQAFARKAHGMARSGRSGAAHGYLEAGEDSKATFQNRMCACGSFYDAGVGGADMTITTEEAERLARFHDISKELYSDSPEDSGTCAMHHTSAAALRSLAAERDALKAEVERPESGVSYEAFVSAMQIVTTERDALRAESARLREALRLGVDAVEFWAAYASPYFQDKHDLAEDLRKLRAALGETQ